MAELNLEKYSIIESKQFTPEVCTAILFFSTLFQIIDIREKGVLGR